MPIEFRCTQCGKLLRTPDDTAGKRAKCPECAALLTIPAVQAPVAGVPPPAAGPFAPTSAPGGSGGAVGPPPGAGQGAGSPFAPGVPPAAVNPYQSPAPYAAGYAAAAVAPAPGAWQPSRIDFGDVFGRTWRIFTRRWGACLVAALVVLAVWLGAGLAVALLAVLAGEATNSEGLTVLVALVAGAAACVVGMWVTVGQAMYFLKTARGNEALIGDLFAGGPYFLAALGATMLYMLAVMGGMLLCYVPGIIFGLMFSQYLFLVIDRNAGAVESLSLSKDITNGNKLMLFAIQLVAGIVVQMAGYATCGLATIVAMPFMMLLSAVIYLAMTGQPTADQAWRVPLPGTYAPPGT